MVSRCGMEIYRFGSLLLGDMYEVLFGWFNQCREMEIYGNVLVYLFKAQKEMV